MSLRVLLVDDDERVRASIAETLGEEGADVAQADSAEAALSRVAAFDPDVVLSDIRMPGLSGLELLTKVRAARPGTAVVLMTAFDDMPTVARAMREGAADFLVKPIRLVRLREVLDRIETDRRARREASGPTDADGVPDAVGRLLVGRDPAMLEVYKLIGRVASGRINALIRGETGTGKERVARAIHESSPWADRPFVAVNCAALPEPLLESELFGHVKGAFTGATSDRAGRFASAGSGTVLLDEIGDTTPAFQAKLLRVLEGGEFTPVGGDVLRRTEARVLAATHRDLEAAVRAGAFRTDLYYRLKVVELRLPPLRDRLGDLPALARHLLERAVRTTDQAPAILTDEALQRLLAHSWPGNVRELDHCLTRALVLATGGVIRPEHLALDHFQPTEAAAPESGARASEEELATFPTLEELESRHLQRALALSRGNKTRAAELLGVSKPRLYRMLERHGHR